MNDTLGFFLNKIQETNNRGLASQGKVGICKINTPNQPNIKLKKPEKYLQTLLLVQKLFCVNEIINTPILKSKNIFCFILFIIN
jgi:hypothetical protein